MSQSSAYHFGYQHIPKIREAMMQNADRALSLAPALGEASLAKGYALYYGDADYDAALAVFQRAREQIPNSAAAIFAIGTVERRQSRWQESIDAVEAATMLDPRNPLILLSLAQSYELTRQPDKALTLLNRLAELDPDDAEAIAFRAELFQAEGDLAAADALLQGLPPKPDDSGVFDTQMQQLLLRRRFDDAIEALRPALASGAVTQGDGIGGYYAMLALAQRRAGKSAAATATYTEGRKALLKLREQGFDTASCRLSGGNGGRSRQRRCARREAEYSVTLCAKDGIRNPSSRTWRARTETILGDRDAALRDLEQLLKDNGGEQFLSLFGVPLTPSLLKLDPVWDPLRGDPRFQQLIADSATAALAPAAAGT